MAKLFDLYLAAKNDWNIRAVATKYMVIWFACRIFWCAI